MVSRLCGFKNGNLTTLWCSELQHLVVWYVSTDTVQGRAAFAVEIEEGAAFNVV